MHFSLSNDFLQSRSHSDVFVAEIYSNLGIRAAQRQLTIVVAKIHKDLEHAARVTCAYFNAGLRISSVRRDVC
jgi:hypothetical protein